MNSDPISYRHYEAIDFLKGYAILGIVLFHLCQILTLPPILEKATHFGGSGIHTFFFLSGFGIYLSQLQRPLSYGNFLRKKFFKIYLPYILVVSLIALLCLFIPVYHPVPYSYLGHLLLFKMFNEEMMGSYGYQLWFISVILSFYLLFPLFCRLKNKCSGKLFLLIGICISLGWSLFVHFIGKSDYRSWNSFFPQYCWEFMAGMIAAEYTFRFQKNFWEIPGKYLGFLTLASLLLFTVLGLNQDSTGGTFNDFPAFFSFTGVGVVLYRWQFEKFNRFLMFIGSISYPLFLIHMFVIAIVRYVLNQSGQTYTIPMAFFTLIICILAAYFLQKGIQSIQIKSNSKS